jgi:hypothetical protein
LEESDKELAGFEYGRLHYKVQEALVVEHAFASLNVGQLLLGKGGQWRHNRLWELSQ